MNQQTGRSKGYAFFEFSNYKEFCEALNIKEPLIFGKQKLVLNSAKNRFDYEEYDKINELGNSNSQLIEDRKSLDSLNSLNQNRPSSSTETGISSVRNSKESTNSIGNNYNFLGDKMKPEINYLNTDNDSNDLQLQIKDSLKKLSEQYYMNQNENKSSLFNYYCTPFLYTNYNNKIINGVQLKFNWVHSLEQKANFSKITKFTVRYLYYFFFNNYIVICRKY